MSGGGEARYAELGSPWPATIGMESDHPARFLAAMANQTLRHQVPAGRRLGQLWAMAGRRGLPERPLAAAVGLLPRRARADLDELLERAAGGWDRLAARSLRLPASPPPLTALAMPRRAGLTVFVFGSAPHPLLVLKLPGGGEADGIDREARALARAEPARVAPRPLGRIGEARAQEGLAGAPVPVRPLTPDRARALPWPEPFADLASGLARLAEVTARRAPAGDDRAPIQRAMEEPTLAARHRRLLAAAWRDVARLQVSVLCHGDPKPQNWLTLEGELQGIVDWEEARWRGTPGFDAWHAMVDYVEFGVGLTRWSRDARVACFQAAWTASDFCAGARRAARSAAAAAGVPTPMLDSLELAFFGRRLGRRLLVRYPDRDSAAVAAGMLAVVCGS
jgi:Phosphotransferase enzyme family